MLVNRTTVLVGQHVVLVPTYHAWMQDPELQAQTASEPLSLAAEYEMQQSWRDDPDKLAHLLAHCEMAGDVNLFLHQRYDDDDDDDDADDAARPTTWGELEIMIANPQVRRRGLAHEALRLFVHYVLTTSLGGVELPASRLFARVALENTPSLGLFTKLGFVQHSVSDVFQEAELRLGAAPPAAPPVSVLAWPETTGPSVPGPAHAPDQTPPPSQA